MKSITNTLACVALICFLAQPTISRAEAEVVAATPPTCNGSSTLEIASKSLTVEVAADLRSRRYGLMFRESMGENCGMLFVFQNNLHRTFTMQNMLIPLDIAFISSDGIIAEMITREPGSKRYPSQVEAVYALEVNAGWFEKNNLGVGSQVLFKSGEALEPLSGLAVN